MGHRAQRYSIMSDTFKAVISRSQYYKQLSVYGLTACGNIYTDTIVGHSNILI